MMRRFSFVVFGMLLAALAAYAADPSWIARGTDGMVASDSPEASQIGAEVLAAGGNAFDAAVAVTAGLLKRLSRDELQGVIAHEIGHIRNMDVRFMTLAAVMVGAIALISDAFLRGFLRGGAGRARRSRAAPARRRSASRAY